MSHYNGYVDFLVLLKYVASHSDVMNEFVLLKAQVSAFFTQCLFSVP